MRTTIADVEPVSTEGGSFPGRNDEHCCQLDGEGGPDDPVRDEGDLLPPVCGRIGLEDEDGDERERRCKDDGLERRVDAAGLVLLPPHGRSLRHAGWRPSRSRSVESDAEDDEGEDRRHEPESSCAANVQTRVAPPASRPDEEQSKPRDDDDRREPLHDGERKGRAPVLSAPSIRTDVDRRMGSCVSRAPGVASGAAWTRRQLLGELLDDRARGDQHPVGVVRPLPRDDGADALVDALIAERRAA